MADTSYLRKKVRVMPPGTENPHWEKVNIRGIRWEHTPSWVLTTPEEYAKAIPGQIETVIDSGGWLPGLKEVHVEGYVPGGWTLPVVINLDFLVPRYTVNGIQKPLQDIFEPNPAWGVVDPTCIVPGVGVTSPNGTMNFAFEPTLAHILVYFGVSMRVDYTCAGLGDFNLCFADEGLKTFCVADGSDMKTGDVRLVTPQGLVMVHMSQAPTSGVHRFDVTMTVTQTSIRTDLAKKTEATYPKASPPPLLVVGRIAGPLTVTNMRLNSLAPTPVLMDEEK